MTSKKATYKDIEDRISQIHKRNKLVIADSNDKQLQDLETLIRERTAELTDIISVLHEEVLQRIEAERSLQERSEQLRSMAARLAATERKERQRLAKVLHDDLQQLLAAAIFQIGDLHLPSDKDASIKDLLRKCIQRTRSLASELSPPLLHHPELVPALEWLGRWMQDNYGLHVSLDVKDPVAVKCEGIRMLLYESVRELLFNVVKHAGSNTARVRIDRMKSRVRIEVSDKGSGFEVLAASDEESSSGGLGLVSIRERLALLGGSMKIESSPGKGSTVALSISE
jgi:two-component system, chemotaxis family, CheB/CheR fusion protein